ncbi:hypothetical protein C1Y22_37055, partial [Pseudomonas sp. MPR-R2A5]|uniref:hypothetical protein n=1 Tax=Pseudomonas sp. MPR-R2A5 TaxID=2070622 RepID=UPI000CA66533
AKDIRHRTEIMCLASGLEQSCRPISDLRRELQKIYGRSPASIGNSLAAVDLRRVEIGKPDEATGPRD